MTTENHDTDVGSSVPVVAIVASAVTLSVIVGGFVGFRWLSTSESDYSVVVATGPETGTYHALGTAIAHVLEADGIVETATAMITEGSVSNMALIGDGTADLAIVQSDTPPNERARLIAPLYEEVLHILVARDVAQEISTIHDLDGRRVSVGNLGSGTRQTALRVLAHFSVQVSEGLSLTPDEAIQSLLDGSIDAAFLLTAIPSQTVDLLCREDAVRFLSLGDAQEAGNEAEGLALVFPSHHATTIPRQTYGRLPKLPVSSIGVTAQLVASRDLEAGQVLRITDALFRNRSHLGETEEDLPVAKRIRERYRPGTVVLPYHQGAVAYYEREEPPFFVEYAEAISLFLTLLVGVYSGSIALREWMRRRKKNRIDGYYVEAVKHTADLGEESTEELVASRDALVKLRQKAFADLVNEKLDANESFTILQDHVNSELENIARLLELRKHSE
jgi:TRAP transporter TAXI family solute receptor